MARATVAKAKKSGKPKSKTKQDEKARWRHSPFASAEIGIAAKAPKFVLELPFAMKWDPQDDNGYAIGQLLASAIAHGALICEDAWQAWVEGLAYAQEEKQLLWVDMNLQDCGSTYRWFADPTTRILILKRRVLKADVEGISARHCLQKFLRRLPHANQTDDLVSLFVDWAVMHWRLRLPPLLLDQALCRLPTVTVSNNVWLEVLGMTTPDPKERPSWETSGRTAPMAKPTFAASKELLQTFNSKGSIESKIFEDAWKLRSIGALSRRQEKNLCIRQLEAAQPTLSPGRKALAEWAVERLTQKRSRPSPKGYAPFTVRQWLYSILEGVYPDSYHEPDFEISLDGLGADVKSVIGKPGNPNQMLIEAAQRDFGRHVNSLKPVQTEEGSEEELEALFGDDDNDPVDHRTTVSAKILSPRTFQEAVKRARHWSPHDQTALIIILGYRAGLRFEEIAGLQVHDFIIKKNEIFELHVQRNRHRTLKTFDSRRILPLDILLTTKELEALRKWLEPRQQRAKQSGKNVYCFGPAESKSPTGSDKKFVERVLNDENKETGERQGRYTFSHLRHSFSSYLLASLLLPDDTEQSLVPTAFRDVVCWKRKRILSDRLLGKERLGQAALHAVSQIMGHTGIYRTLESYQHLLDLALGLYVSRQALQPAFPPEVHSSLRTGLPHQVDAVLKRHEDDLAKKSFADQRRIADRATPVRQTYTTPPPPLRLQSSTSEPAWHRLEFQHASAAYGLAPLRGRSKNASDKGKGSGPLDSRFEVANPVWGVKNWDWHAVWKIVTLSEDQSKELRSSISLCDKTTFPKWQKRYREVLTWGFKRQGKHRSEDACLAMPIGAPAHSMVNWMWIRRNSSKIPPSRRLLIRTFLSCFNDESFYSRMPSMEDAVEFAAFLRAVGVDGRSITIAQGRASDFKDLKSGESPTRDVRDGDLIHYKTWDPPAAFMRKPQNDHRPALWISHIKYEDASLGRSFDLVRNLSGSGDPATGRRLVQHKVNYAYRFALAMMAIVDDEVWGE